MNQKEILNRLKEGNARFVNAALRSENQDDKRRADVADGQQPYAIVLSCADSRVVPELAFDTGLGELFVVRVAGNVANASSLASMEYAVANLGSSVIVVMGHQNCGAVTAALQGGDNGPNLNHLLKHIHPAIAQAGGDADLETVVKTNATATVETICKQSDIIAKAVQEKKLLIVSAYYHLDSGEVEFLDKKM